MSKPKDSKPAPAPPTTSPKRGRDGLTDKQRLFVKIYQLNGRNATQAAISAGYSHKSADKIGSELLGKTRVKRVIDREIAAREHRLGIKTDKMLADLYAIATGKITDVFDYDSDGLRLKPSDCVDKRKLAAIESVQESTTPVGTNMSVKMHAKLPAAIFLLKYYGKYVEKQKHDVEGKLTLEKLVGAASDEKEEGNGE